MVLYNRYKKIIGWALAAALTAVNFTPQIQSVRALPDSIGISAGEKVTYTWELPVKANFEGEAVAALSDQSQTISDAEKHSFTISSDSACSGVVKLRLFGIIPVKSIAVSVYDSKTLIPGGAAIGVTLKTVGVLVAGMSPVLTKEGKTVSPAQDAGLRSGDYILKVNDTDVTSVSALVSLIEREAGHGAVSLTVKRGETLFTAKVTPAKDASETGKLGIWARDSTAGVGTVTFYDPSTQTFGALGHPITDADTGVLLSVSGGDIYEADVLGVKKGERGAPGELRGVFSADGKGIGTLTTNTWYGIFGSYRSDAVRSLYPEGIPVAARSGVRTGAAQILSSVSDQGIRAYDCEIVQLFEQNSISTKSMVVKITDPELLELTGGIVQGMSGSPIVQDGRIVGALTHVYVSDPTRGYGIYMDWMLEAAKN